MKVAVIDIGTLKVKCLVAEVNTSGEFATIYQSSTLTCLGVRMQNNKPQAKYLQQTIDELKRCKDLFKKENVKKLRVVSTHALREMKKAGKEIAELIEREAGFKIEIITQKEEANLFFQAVIKDFTTNEDFTVVDVGGGSVQILIGNKHKLKNVYLLKTGAQYLYDTFTADRTGDTFPTREEIRTMQKYILEQLTPIPEKIQTPVIYGSTCIIDVFKAMKLKMDNYPYSKSHPYKVDTQSLEDFLEHIIPIPYGQRDEMYKTEKYYMWGIDKALLNILSICKKEQSPYVIPTNANINNGLLLSMA